MCGENGLGSRCLGGLGPAQGDLQESQGSGSVAVFGHTQLWTEQFRLTDSEHPGEGARVDFDIEVTEVSIRRLRRMVSLDLLFQTSN